MPDTLARQCVECPTPNAQAYSAGVAYGLRRLDSRLRSPLGPLSAANQVPSGEVAFGIGHPAFVATSAE